MTFIEPMNVGELITFKAAVNAVWRTSMEIGVRVEAERPAVGDRAPHQHRLLHDGRPRRGGPPDGGAPLGVETDEERRREREAQTRRHNRLAEREQLQRVGLS